jgi:hypothetical protein
MKSLVSDTKNISHKKINYNSESVDYKYINRENREIREQKLLQKEMDKTYKYYQYIVSTIPQYMLNNLKNMNNNTGYIWKGIHLYGEKPYNEKEPLKMEEKIKDTVYIHEWNKGKYRMYVKQVFEKNNKKFNLK